MLAKKLLKIYRLLYNFAISVVATRHCKRPKER